VRRDPDRLRATTFDLLVVGGGIYGLAVAYDAAQRGASVALVEAADFGSGSSFNHLRTIHGGLRYLQSLDVRRARASIRERRTLARIAPHSLEPRPFVLPLRRSLTRGPLAMRVGFALDRLIGVDRNRGVPAARRLAPGRVIGRARAIERFPGLFRGGLAGAAVWEDYVTTEADRLTFSVALAAARQGAALCNYLQAERVVTDGADGRRVVAVEAVDRLSGAALTIAARCTVLAAGAAIAPLAAPLGLAANTPLVRAMNLVTRREAGDEALGGSGRLGRNLFLVPWKRRALFGTWESGTAVQPGATEVDPSEVRAFIAALNDAFPGLDLTAADVTLVHSGLVPAIEAAGGGVGLRGREVIQDHAANGVSGLISIAGTKYTTARGVAERVVDRVFERLGRRAAPCRTGDVPLPGGAVRDVALTVAELRRGHDGEVPSETIPHLVAGYGTAAADVLALAREKPEWRRRLADDSPVVGAQLVRAVRDEMAVTLADAVIRRTPLGALGEPAPAALEAAATIVGDELAWDPRRRAAEIDRVRAFYGTVKALNT
jgi:glycerol-3-phosphate dehydrogenase